MWWEQLFWETIKIRTRPSALVYYYWLNCCIYTFSYRRYISILALSRLLNYPVLHDNDYFLLCRTIQLEYDITIWFLFMVGSFPCNCWTSYVLQMQQVNLWSGFLMYYSYIYYIVTFCRVMRFGRISIHIFSFGTVCNFDLFLSGKVILII